MKAVILINLSSCISSIALPPWQKKILGYRANYLINYISFKPIKYISQKYS